MSYEYADPFNPWSAARAATECMLDAWQRTILTWDVLRERYNQSNGASNASATSGEPSVRTLRGPNPARLDRWYFSELNPWMAWIKVMAEAVRKDVRPASPPNPLAHREVVASRQIAKSSDRAIDAHDDAWLKRFVREATCA